VINKNLRQETHSVLKDRATSGTDKKKMGGGRARKGGFPKQGTVNMEREWVKNQRGSKDDGKTGAFPSGKGCHSKRGRSESVDRGGRGPPGGSTLLNRDWDNQLKQFTRLKNDN